MSVARQQLGDVLPKIISKKALTNAGVSVVLHNGAEKSFRMMTKKLLVEGSLLQH